MPTINMLEAKTHLSRLVEALESGAETEIVIARNGKPAARLVPLRAEPVGVRIGVAKGKFTMPNDIDGANDLIAEMFGVTPE
jgi:antitoxin (DNA-binding transcriptional repressor) of toxin-antitoxin stability system